MFTAFCHVSVLLVDKSRNGPPPSPRRATEIPAADCSREEYVEAALNMLGNTAPFDVSGHSAISAPCGMVDGLPVGLMIVGKRYDEATVLRVAEAFEQSGDWHNM